MRLVRITHPFHPLSGKELPYVGERYNRYGRRFLLRVDEVAVCSVPLQWTDLAAPDPEIVIGKQRALFRVADLLELARLVDEMREERSPRKVGVCKANLAADVNEKTPHGRLASRMLLR